MASKVEGVARLKARFAKIPQRMREEVRVAIDASADELVTMQKRLVPVEHGDLRDSIRKEEGVHDLSVEVKAGSKNVFYAKMIEFGTRKMQARPFFFPAYRTLRRRIRSRIARAMSKALKR